VLQLHLSLLLLETGSDLEIFGSDTFYSSFELGFSS
jgi:hypothetical protein